MELKTGGGLGREVPQKGARPEAISDREWSSQDLVETRFTLSRHRLEGLWADASQMAMPSSPIVEGIDVIRDVCDRQLAILVDMLLDLFLLQTAEEGLGDGVIPAVPSPAHAGDQTVRLAESLPTIAPVSGALIGVNDRVAGLAFTNSFEHGIEYQFTMKSGARRPANDLAREQIHHDSQVQPALPSANVRDVSYRPAAYALRFVEICSLWSNPHEGCSPLSPSDRS